MDPLDWRTGLRPMQLWLIVTVAVAVFLMVPAVFIAGALSHRNVYIVSTVAEVGLAIAALPLIMAIVELVRYVLEFVRGTREYNRQVTIGAIRRKVSISLGPAQAVSSILWLLIVFVWAYFNLRAHGIIR